MEIIDTQIPDVKIIRPKKFGDHRGFFSEVYNKSALSEAGYQLNFVQDNHSRTAQKGTIRGFHFQSPPYAQTKLVRVLKGAILDVAVDIRKNSPTYSHHVAIELTAEGWDQLLVPKGFAHGILTLTDDTEVFYKVDDHYAPQHDLGVIWSDPEINIDWPLAGNSPILSEKDAKHPFLSELDDYFSQK